MTDPMRPWIPKLRRLRELIDSKASFQWGRVATASPVTVFLDGDVDESLTPIATPAQTAISGLVVGDRVRCMRQGSRVTVEQLVGTGPASQAQVDAGADNGPYVTPATLRNADFLPFATAAGSFSFSALGSGSSVQPTVTFPAGRFTTAPRVTALTSQSRVNVAQASKTASSVTLTLANWTDGTSSSGTVEWWAVQMAPDSASG